MFKTTDGMMVPTASSG